MRPMRRIQQCSELGNFQTTVYIPLQFFLNYCEEIFTIPREYILERIKITDQVLEDMDENSSVRKVFLTQAENDPWSATKVRNHNRTYYLKDAFHCEDLKACNKNNKPSIQKLKRDIYWEVQKLQVKN
ncbi:uncharacterized protein LOC123256984 [Drosophila ananassae]|uniref:uncharacterized protein LOC123256984 n=1 Tax=Drosophila ananassae TaxID=7217 RepID=UPI001CFF5551|nr:uncharacterized protein LOC123256984 [Drosophila ananassae]